MRFHRVRVDAFGSLRDLDTGSDGLPGFVVVHGSNEAGKSTFFEFLVAMLYGFYPASRDANPWAPWDGATASGGAWLRLDDGACWEVHRRLLGSPAGSLVRGSAEEPLRNHTLPCVRHVPRRVFRQVYALTLQELASLDADGWAAVQDRIVGALGARDLRPPRRVADDLEAEAGALWRPNRRGRQAVREVTARIRELGYRRSEAREAERKVRALRRELERTTARLDEARREREACRERLDRARAAAPARRRLERIAELEVRAGPAQELDGLPDDPPAHLAELRRARERRAERLAGIERERVAPEEALAAFGARQRALLERERDIEALATRMAASEPDRIRIGLLEQEVRDLTRRVEGNLDAVPAAVPPPADAIERVRPSDLRRSLQALRRAEDDLRVASGVGAARTASGPAWTLGAMVLLGTGLAVAGIVAGSTGLTTAGLLIVLVAGAATTVVVTRARRRERVSRRAAEERVRGARAEAEELLRPIGVPAEAALAAPELPSTLERARDLLRDLADRRAALERSSLDMESLAGAIRELRDELPLESGLPDDDGLAMHVLRTGVREAGRRAEAARAAERERRRLLADETRIRSELESLSRELGALEDRLRELGDGDVARGAEEARQRLAARRRALELRAELDPGDAQIGVPPPQAEGDVEALARRERELLGSIEELARSVEAQRTELEHLGRRETLDDLDGEVRNLEEERLRLVRRRDRLHLLARVLREADRWIREEHQPDVLRRAGRHLATLTAGRYDRLLVAGEDGRSFLVRGPSLPGGTAVDRPLSTGTREQVYLALRLALLDALDGGRERLPLVLDEVLVNWDPERRARGLDLLARLAEDRQVLLFTCHPDLAHAAVARGAGALALGGP